MPFTPFTHLVRTSVKILTLGCIFGFVPGIERVVAVETNSESVEPLEPEVAEASDEGEAAMQTVRLDGGLKIELAAAEPLVANIVAMDVDRKGRLFICETFRQNRGVTDNRAHDQRWLEADLAAETVQDRIDYHRKLLGEAAATYAQHIDRVRRLADDDGDGQFDQVTTLASGFNSLEEGTGASVLVLESDVYYTCIPKLWKFIDKDDDGVADDRLALADGFGVRVAFRGHDLHGLTQGYDGRIYFSIGDRGYHITTDDGRVLANPSSGAVFRCEPDGSDLTIVAMGLRNPQELAFNDRGDWFSVDNNSDSGDKARIVQILPNADSGWRMNYQYLGDRGIFNREKVWEPYFEEQSVAHVPPIANFTDGPSGLAYYPGTGFGDAFNDQFFICDFRGGPANSGIRAFQLEPDGAYYRLGKTSEPVWQTLATDLVFAPEGGFYVSDWVNGWDGLGKGRVYRITSKEHQSDPIVKETKDILASNLKTEDIESLVRMLSHQDRRVRLLSQFEIASREEMAALAKVANDDSYLWNTRLHALWGSAQIARRNEGTRVDAINLWTGLVKDKEIEVRRTAIRLIGEMGGKTQHPLLAKAVEDSEVRVRFAAIMAAAEQSVPAAFDAVVTALKQSEGSDPALRHAVIEYFRSNAVRNEVMQLSSDPVSFVRRCAIAALRKERDGRLVKFLEDKDPIVVAEAVRAIHDDAMVADYGAIAGLIAGDIKVLTDETMARIVNVNDRIHDAVAAKNLAAAAADMRLNEPLRQSALESLASWTEVRKIDRYDHAFRPREGGKTNVAAEALRPYVETLLKNSGDVREVAIDAASRLGIQDIASTLAERIQKEELSFESRATSLRGLSRLNAKLATKLAVNLISGSAAGELRRAALEVVASDSSESSVNLLIEGTKTGEIKTRQVAFDLLSKQPGANVDGAIADAVQAYLDGKLEAELHLNVLEASQDRLGSPLADSLAAHQKTLAENDPLGKYLASMAGGDVEAGSKLFYEKTELSCVRCHRVHRTGGEVGPVLTTIGAKKEPRYLLESIALPNAQIAKGFETAVVVDAYGDTYSGIVVSETDELLTLLKSDGTRVSILVDDIEARRKGLSSMPADLVKQMTPRELRDLVAYLESLKVDPRAVSDDVE